MTSKTDNTMQRVTSGFMQDLYVEQNNDRKSKQGLIFIRRLGERSSQVFGSGHPFQLDCLHIGVVCNGEQNVSVNLKQHHLAKGSVLIATPESILQQTNRSNNFEMQVIHIDGNTLHGIYGDKIPISFTNRMSDIHLSLNDKDYNIATSILDILWQTLQTDYKTCCDNILAALLNLIVDLSRRDEQSRQSVQPRNVTVFNNFLSLVAEHCNKERTLDFYANKLCLSKQYLGSIICAVSHRSAREWIDEAAIARIKVMLQHSETPLNEISQKMSFPEPSHFSRYFKRLTGMSPKEYRCL